MPRFYLILILLFLFFNKSFSQIELVEVSNPVYDFFKRMQLMKIIPQYNSSDIPISRSEAAKYIIDIKKNINTLNAEDRNFLNDYENEFEFEISGKTGNQVNLFGKNGLKSFTNYNKIKHTYFYTDSNKTFFGDVTGLISQRGSSGDSMRKNSVFLGEFGIKIRGSLFNSVGYYLKLSNGQIASGNDSALIFASATDVILNTNKNLIPRKNYNVFEGYLRYQTKTNWLSVTFGRTPVNFGFGYIDKLFLSNNTVPFDFGKLDLNYKSVNYSFAYGSINGDSVNKQLKSKNIATHYLNINFSNSFKLGLWESVIISNQPFSFTYLNPVSFLTSADLSIGKDQTTENNSLLGIEMEIIPFRNFSFQSSLLVDDLTFGTLGKKDSLNENKFGWQFGTQWTNSLNMNLMLEFTHLDPFVYSHRSNKSTYTNYSLSLGHALPPNSDEIAAKLSYDISNRLKLVLLYQHQRSGEGIILDSTGKVIANYGGNINFGSGDAYLRTNGFLDGTRIDRDIFTANFYWQLLRQFYLEGKFQYRIINNITKDLKFKDSFYFATLRIEL